MIVKKSKQRPPDQETSYLTTKQLCERENVSKTRVTQWCLQGALKGAKKMCGCWFIPADAPIPPPSPQGCQRGRKAMRPPLIVEQKTEVGRRILMLVDSAKAKHARTNHEVPSGDTATQGMGRPPSETCTDETGLEDMSQGNPAEEDK